MERLGVAVRHPLLSAATKVAIQRGSSAGHPTWRPDGRALLVRGKGPGVGISLFVVDLVEGVSDDEFRPTWSADSTRLLVARLDAGVITLVLAPADGSSPGMATDPITGSPAGDWSVSWSPDETLILGTDHDRGRSVLVDAATGRATPTDWGITGGADRQPLP